MPDLARERWYLIALLLALAGSIGSVWLSVAMELKACPLCFYQRSAAFLALTTLLLGWVSPVAVPRPVAALLAVPACFLGLGVAAFHVWLELSETLECPTGIGALGTAPQQSLVAFLLLTPAVVLATRSAAPGRARRLSVAVLLGLCAALASIKGSPPLPKAPSEPHKDALVTCRPPYKAPA